ncbi:MAG: tetratricopeptide repeat protein [Planctomycetota bacterium]
MSLPDPLEILPAARHELDRAGQEFLADFFRAETDRHPDNLGALASLAEVLTQMGRLEEGLATDQKLLRLAPDNPTVHYNLACSLALLGHVDGALDALERAVELGYDDAEHLVRDDDLHPLRREPRFQRLVRRLEAARSDVSSR